MPRLVTRLIRQLFPDGLDVAVVFADQRDDFGHLNFQVLDAFREALFNTIDMLGQDIELGADVFKENLGTVFGMRGRFLS